MSDATDINNLQNSVEHDMPYETTSSFISMRDLTRLHAIRYVRKETKGRGRKKQVRSNAPLLCIPTELGGFREYEQIVPLILSHPNGPNVVWVLELRGRGQSEYTDAEDIVDADDLITFCDAVGLHNIDILCSGRSMLNVLLTGPKRPGLVRKLVLSDAAPEFDAVGVARLTALSQRAGQPKSWIEATDILKDRMGKSFPSFSESDWTTLSRIEWKDVDGAPQTDHHKNLYRATNSANFDARQATGWDELKLFRTTPTLLLRGEHSELVTEDITDRMKNSLSDLTVVIAEGQGHVPLLSKGDLVSEIAQFLSRQSEATH